MGQIILYGVLIFFALWMFLFIKKSEDNSKLHRYYLNRISRLSDQEFEDKIYHRYAARYNWLRKCHSAAYEDGWRIWKPARSYYVDGEIILRRGRPDDNVFTYHLDPNIPVDKAEYVVRV